MKKIKSIKDFKNRELLKEYTEKKVANSIDYYATIDSFSMLIMLCKQFEINFEAWLDQEDDDKLSGAGIGSILLEQYLEGKVLLAKIQKDLKNLNILE
jgi:hypothetical protein